MNHDAVGRKTVRRYEFFLVWTEANGSYLSWCLDRRDTRSSCRVPDVNGGIACSTTRCQQSRTPRAPCESLVMLELVRMLISDRDAN